MALSREQLNQAAAKAARGGMIDRVVEAFNPAAAQRRQQARFALEVTRTAIGPEVTNSGYSEGGANPKKSFARGGGMSSLDARQDINLNLPTLRRNSRSCYMNDPLARAALARTVNFSVGTGLRLLSRPDAETLGISREAAAAWARKAEGLYNAHFNSRACDVQGLNTGDELQALALLAWLQSGDVFALLPYRAPAAEEISGLRVLLVEADRVVTPSGQTDILQQKLLDGVEVDDSGRVVAYHIARTYPIGTTQYSTFTASTSGVTGTIYQGQTDRVEVRGARSGRRNILHLIACERPGQWRGVPFLAPIIEPLRNLGKYRESELTAAVVASLFTVFIATPDRQVPLGNAYPDEERVSEGATDENYVQELGPGTIIAGEPGQEPKIIDPHRPNRNFEAFSTAIAREIGAALGIPYEVLIAHFDSSFSASRGALQVAWQGFLTWRRRMAQNYCQPCFEEFITEQILLGRLDAPGYFDDPLRRAAWLRAYWYGPSMPVLNPVQEVTAAEKRVASRFSTRTREAAEMTGMDFHSEILPEQAVEEEELAAAGLTPLVLTTRATPVPPA